MSNHLLWDDADKDAVNTHWYAELMTILRRYATSYYVNQMEGPDQAVRMKACFSSENWQRLFELRQKYDPDKRFFAHMA
jgi:FAD/FMN-containing dehydrogenase